jgi:hypothetical protein
VGRHTFPFDFGLPDILPSSFEGPWGYIRYVINATLDRPWSFNTNYKRAFTVISPLDLNIQRNAKVSVKFLIIQRNVTVIRKFLNTEEHQDKQEVSR